MVLPGGRLLPTYLGIILIMLALTVLGALAFNGWRVLAEVRALIRTLARLQARLAPTLEEMARLSEAAAERAARLQPRRGQGPGAADARKPAG